MICIPTCFKLTSYELNICQHREGRAGCESLKSNASPEYHGDCFKTKRQNSFSKIMPNDLPVIIHAPNPLTSPTTIIFLHGLGDDANGWTGAFSTSLPFYLSRTPPDICSLSRPSVSNPCRPQTDPPKMDSAQRSSEPRRHGASLVYAEVLFAYTDAQALWRTRS